MKTPKPLLNPTLTGGSDIPGILARSLELGFEI
jgi:hypothetical protein